MLPALCGDDMRSRTRIGNPEQTRNGVTARSQFDFPGGGDCDFIQTQTARLQTIAVQSQSSGNLAHNPKADVPDRKFSVLVERWKTQVHG